MKWLTIPIILIAGALIFRTCSTIITGPVAKITIKVVDEQANPIANAKVGIGFARNTSRRDVNFDAVTRNNGKFAAEWRTNGMVGARIFKEGYYESSVDYRFNKRSGNRWEPWNPEVTVVLRKIENPVPMYAREVKLILPVLNQDVGYDLISSDWIPPYGKGVNPDIIFNSKSRWTNDHDFDGTLYIKFGRNGGLIQIKEDMRYGSQYKLPRCAPKTGYNKQIIKHIYANPGEPIELSYDKDINYLFKIGADKDNETGIASMYGKVRSDFSYGIKNNIATVVFTYYLNPDHTTNLEFDPKRNLFPNLPPSEAVAQP